MKTLIVHNEKGQLIFSQTNATEQYNCLVEEVADNKEVIGVDLKTNKFILADRLATTEEKEQLKRELEAKNLELENKNKELKLKSNELANKENELNSTKQELLSTQATVVDVTYNNLVKENGGI
ncbi:hypothetical protein [Clostridium botulinum]|uniref:hypothetical protein n=1 Tax=Clostridium botulinum TaxID=1491 RepID=UPI000773C9AE|nr:hypothetical protein [Clostridium botulinum]NFE94537.1 hypothetical protein [Clostridium botulinum]NFL39516.1 hypothetical protein [Clostridium botulinum]NFL65260.1 hypothetical protein [Clostridium botulinum]NFN08352.1 hypothetical protein [Clostridium botulinum]NFN32232.1 hypothetical protein [Clostridium botulinum]